MKKNHATIVLVAIAAGVIEAFSVMRLDGVFSNIQAGNILLGAVALVNGQWEEAGIRALSVAAFVVGTAFCHLLWTKLRGRSFQYVLVTAGSIILISAVVLPESMSGTTVFLLALLCGFWFRSEPEREGDGYAAIVLFGIGVLAGATLYFYIGNLILMVSMVVFALSETLGSQTDVS